jgi:DNA-binding transcriptional LysR family regulator
MFLAQLEVLVEVARLGSVSLAAEALSLTQPTVSWRLRALESAVGTPLFVRTRRGVRITDAGKALLPHAMRAVDAATAAHLVADGLTAQTANPSESISIASIANVSVSTLPDVLAEVHRRLETLEITVRVDRSEDVAQLVSQGHVALGLVADLQHPGVERIPLYEDQMVLVASRSLLPARWRTQDLAATTLILQDPRANAQRHIRAVLRDAAVTPNRLLQMDTVEAARELVLRGVGMSFLPRTHVTAGLANGSLREIDLPGASVLRDKIVALRKIDAGKPSVAVALLISLLRKTGRRMAKVQAR